MPRQPTGPDTPPDGNNLDPRSRAFYWLIMQGLGVVVLTAWLYTMWLDNRIYRTEVKACQTEMIQIQQEQNVQLIKALNDLTEAMEDLKNEKNRKR